MIFTLIEEFEIHNTLNKKLFENDKLKSEIRDRLIEVADTFVASIKEDKIPIKVYDYWLVGSNASYNYTNNSDIDIHIIVDISQYGKKSSQRVINYLKENSNIIYLLESGKFYTKLKKEELQSFPDAADSSVHINMMNRLFGSAQDKRRLPGILLGIYHP